MNLGLPASLPRGSARLGRSAERKSGGHSAAARDPVRAAILAVRQMAVVLATPSGERLADLETWIGPEGVPHVNGSIYDSTRFTGTSFGGLVLEPLTRSAEAALVWGRTFGTLLLVVALGLVAARAAPAGRPAHLAAGRAGRHLPAHAVAAGPHGRGPARGRGICALNRKKAVARGVEAG
ncbi:hypothetical protein GCM10010300_01060 [Streptomyces olivaceoviridis]|nr:hypothetical protein GCM10010300_01060 [Streptomyces olivaceoviridis]